MDAGIDGFAEALYERLLRPEGWRAYADTVPTLRALYAAGVPVAVVSNIGFDIRPLLRCAGLRRVRRRRGRCRTRSGAASRTRRSSGRRAALLGVEPERTLMVGDTPADAGAVDAGCRALVLPAAPPGGLNGLTAALSLALG